MFCFEIKWRESYQIATDNIRRKVRQDQYNPI